MKLTNELIEEYRRIVAEAPEGTTEHAPNGFYRWNHANQYTSLDTLNTIVTLHDENARLRGKIQQSLELVEQLRDSILWSTSILDCYALSPTIDEILTQLSEE